MNRSEFIQEYIDQYGKVPSQDKIDYFINEFSNSGHRSNTYRPNRHHDEASDLLSEIRSLAFGIAAHAKVGYQKNVRYCRQSHIFSWCEYF